MAEYLPTDDGRPLKTTDRMLEHMHELYRTRRSTIRVCMAFAVSFPELTEQMDWIMTVGLEAGDLEREQAWGDNV